MVGAVDMKLVVDEVELFQKNVVVFFRDSARAKKGEFSVNKNKRLGASKTRPLSRKCP